MKDAMVKLKALISSEHTCPLSYEKAVGVLTKKWNGQIFLALMSGPRRFTEIRDYAGGLSDRLLSQRLRELEEEGVVERRVHSTRPVLVEYSLTKKGADLRRVVEAIQVWADRWEADTGVKEATASPKPPAMVSVAVPSPNVPKHV